MSVVHETGHVVVHQGDALTVLRTLPDESVDTCVTSPPYWGLRDYGTAKWEGGDAACDHRYDRTMGMRASTLGGGKSSQPAASVYRDCPKCGATRIDSQLGLEPTPDKYVQNMVAVFREVRRVLRPHGTLWLNLGDSYASDVKGSGGTAISASMLNRKSPESAAKSIARQGMAPKRVEHGLKPKDMVGIPWRVAFSLQADGWYLRSDIIWAKPNPMPESVTDRPTKSHEYVFLLSKSERYFFDQEAVREPAVEWDDADRRTSVNGMGNGVLASGMRFGGGAGGRNIRSVWNIATQPYPEAHFATFPRELPERCIKAGTPEQVCSECGKARERITDGDSYYRRMSDEEKLERTRKTNMVGNGHGGAGRGPKDNLGERIAKTIGFTDCGHNAYTPGTVLDPFAGSGTTLAVARDLGRKSIGIELNPEYVSLIRQRTAQEGLW